MRRNGGWVAAGVLEAAGILRQCRKNAGELVRIQAARIYLKSVDIVRDLFLYQLGVLMAAVFLTFGVILIEGAAIFLLPLEPKMRGIIALLTGGFDVLAAFVFLRHFASSERWLRQASKYNAFLEEFLEEGCRYKRNGGIS